MPDESAREATERSEIHQVPGPSGYLRRRNIVPKQRCGMTLVIMLVDDEQSVRELLTLALEDKGYRVLQAVNGRHALTLMSDLSGVRPDLIISDVMMPLLDGVGLCRAIKNGAGTAGIPVILMTAASPSATADARADAVVAKPFDLDAIDPLIESVLAAMVIPEEE